MDDDPEPRKPPMGPRNLEDMSVFELEDYTAELQDEIERVKQSIEKKKASQAAAASIFKS